MSTLAGPLRLPGFGRIATSYLVNELGNWLGEIALAILVWKLTGSPLATAALFVAMLFIPALATPPLVARLDRIRASNSLPVLYLGEALVFGLLAMLASDPSAPLGLILALAAIDGTIAVTARALTRATAVAVISPAGLLREGNAILNFFFTVGAAAGPAIAGLVVAGAGASTALAADAVSFLLIAALLAGPFGVLPRPAPDDDDAGNWRARMAEGLRYIRERGNLGRLLVAQSAAFVFFALVIPIEVIFAERTLGAGDVGYGLLLTSWGAGMVAGSALFAVLRHRSLQMLLILSTSAIALAYGITAVAPTIAVACAASVLGGLGNGVQWVALITAAQELTAKEQQARVASILESLASIMPGLGFVLGGVLTAALSPRLSYAVAAIGLFTVLGLAVYGLRGWRPAAPQATNAGPAVERRAGA